MTPMPDRPHELIMAQDFAQQLSKELGDRHPAAQYVEYQIQLTKASVPTHLREMVDEDWIWFLNYPFHILARLAKTGEVHPVCWIKRDQICRIRLAASDVFGYDPERMDREFTAIDRSWEAAYDAMADDGSLRLHPPPDLGEYWFGMLVWRTTTERERQRLPTPVLPEYGWTPLYRYGDINRVATILSNDVNTTSPFGNRPIREVTGELSGLRAKYGIQLSKLPRTFRGSKTTELLQHRREMLRQLRDAGYSVIQVINEFSYWASLASEIRQAMASGESQMNHAVRVQHVARRMHAPSLIVEMVQSLLDRYPAEEIDAGIFRRDERTLRRDWESLNL